MATMVDVLVCVKRVPGLPERGRAHRRTARRSTAGCVGLHDERRTRSARSSSPSRSPTRPAGQATVLTLGDARRRRAAPQRARRRLHGGDARRGRRRRRSARPTWPARSRPWSATTRPTAAATTWSCSATTPPTPATSRSASGSPTSSAGRWSTASRRASRSTTAGWPRAVDGPDGARDLRGAAAGGRHGPGGRRRAALPERARTDEGQEGRRSRSARRRRSRSGPSGSQLTLPAARARAACEILGDGPGGRGGRRRPASRSWGCCAMILVLVETRRGGASPRSRSRRVTFARALSAAGRRRRHRRGRRSATCRMRPGASWRPTA